MIDEKELEKIKKTMEAYQSAHNRLMKIAYWEPFLGFNEYIKKEIEKARNE